MAKRRDFPVKEDGQLHADQKGPVPTEPTPIDSNDIYETRAIVSGCECLNVRLEPAKDAKIIGLLPKGTIVEQRATTGEWGLIHTIGPQEIQGYVMKIYLKVL